MCGRWQRAQADAGGRVSTWAGTEARGARARLRVVVSRRGAVAPSCRRAVVSPLRCVGAGTWAEGGRVDGRVWACRGTVALRWRRRVDEGVGGCTGHGRVGGGVGGCGGAWTGTRARMRVLAPRAATLRVAAWAWAWARRGRAARPWVRRVSDTLLRASPAGTGV